MEEKEGYHVGRLLKSIRETVGLSVVKVCYGLCNERSYRRMEAGKREPGSFILDILYERLGGSASLYGITYSLTEYLLLEERNEILWVLKEGNDEITEELLQAYEKELAHIWDRKWEGGKRELHEQFIRYVRAVLRLRQKTKSEDLEEELLEILRLTIPGFEIKQFAQYLYGEQEQTLFVLLAENACRQGRWQEGCSLYQDILTYLEQHLLDKKRLNFLYPQVVSALAKNLAEHGEYRQLGICQKGIACLREQQQISVLEDLVRFSLLGWENGVLVPAGESPNLYRRTLEVIEELRQEYQVWLKKQPYPLLQNFHRGQLIGERILRLRLSLGLAQKELCTEGQESERTIGRIERGEEKPTQERFIRLMEQLGADTCRFYPVIWAEKYELYLAVIELERRVASFEYQAAEKELIKLEKELDTNNRINLQFLKRERAVIDQEFGRITKEEEVQLLWDALHLTVPEGVDLSLWPLTKAEVEILNCISITLEELEDREGAIDLLQKVKKRYEITMNDLVHFRKEPTGKFAKGIKKYRKEGMGLEYNADAYLLILDNLASYIGNDGRYEEAKKMKEEAMKLVCKIGKATMLSDFLYGIAWDKEQMLLQAGKAIESVGEVCLPLYYKSYLVDVMIRQKERAEDTKKLCEKTYGKNYIQWFV